MRGYEVQRQERGERGLRGRGVARARGAREGADGNNITYK